jgi:uncharacterized lipoprotein YehR (DUF1307 family)
MLKAFLNTIMLAGCLLVLISACTGKSTTNKFAQNLIDSSLTVHKTYYYDEVYYLETRYYDHQKQLVKTVKYDDIVRCVIYNVESKEAMQLKSIELGNR